MSLAEVKGGITAFAVMASGGAAIQTLARARLLDDFASGSP
jgi:hypothetical protein